MGRRSRRAAEIVEAVGMVWVACVVGVVWTEPVVRDFGVVAIVGVVWAVGILRVV